MIRLRCVAIDDEPLALNVIAEYIERNPYLELVEKFTNSIKALEYLTANPIDLLFVDIQMPDMTGLQLLSKLEDKPMVVFTTAYDNYAVEGFRLDAVDYLLKPIDYPDFERSVDKALRWVASERVEATRDFLYLKSGHKIVRINFSDITYVQGMSEYIQIYTTTSKPTISLLSLKLLESKLPSENFMRVHKSYIVNLDRVMTIERNEIFYNDGKVIPISPQYREQFNEFIKRNFPL